MKTSAAFFRFRNFLHEVSIDIPTFIRDELLQGPLTKAGWTQNTLQSLFDLNFVPLFEAYYHCRKHGNERLATSQEKSWANILQRLRERVDSGRSIEEVSNLRDLDIEESEPPIEGYCYGCQEQHEKLKLNRERAAERDEEDDSLFLLSIGRGRLWSERHNKRVTVHILRSAQTSQNTGQVSTHLASESRST